MKIINRKARFNYEFLEKIEAGIVLTGQEVKSVKEGRMDLLNAHVRIINSEAILVGANIPAYRFARPENYEPDRSRKLLLRKKETLNLQKKMESKNLTLIPVSCYTNRGRIKMELALARGKKQHEKREKIKKRDIQREQEREVRIKI